MNQYSPNPSASLRPEPKNPLFNARVLWWGLLIGFIASSAYFYFTSTGDQALTSGKILVGINIILLVIVPAATFLARALMFRRRVDGVIPYAAWIRGNAIFWAGCMMVAIFGAQVASSNGDLWPTSLISVTAISLLAVTFPTASQRTPIRTNTIKKHGLPSLAALGILTVAGYCTWEIIKGPAEWATRPPPEAVSTRPDEFIQDNEFLASYLARLHAVEGDRKGVEIKLYGLQRGIPRPDGWLTMTSTGTGFSIAMPEPSIDQRLIGKATDGVAIAIDLVECDSGGLKLRANCTRRSDLKTPGGVQSLLNAFMAHPDKAQIHEVNMAGQKVYDVHSVSNIGFMHIRFFAGDGAVWNWGADYAAADEKTLSPQVERFLESFTPPVQK